MNTKAEASNCKQFTWKPLGYKCGQHKLIHEEVIAESPTTSWDLLCVCTIMHGLLASGHYTEKRTTTVGEEPGATRFEMSDGSQPHYVVEEAILLFRELKLRQEAS